MSDFTNEQKAKYMTDKRCPHCGNDETISQIKDTYYEERKIKCPKCKKTWIEVWIVSNHLMSIRE